MQSAFRTPDADDEISVMDLWQILRKDWWIWIGATLGGGVLAAAGTYLMTPVFDARTVIMEVAPADQNGGAQALLSQFGGLAQFAGLNLDNQRNTSGGGKTLIRSRTFIEEFISRNDLLPAIYPDDWDTERGAWVDGLRRPKTIPQAAEDFKKDAFKLSTDPETGLMSVTIRWTDAQTAADWANELVVLANQISRQKDIAEAERSMAYLNKQIEQTNVVELQRVLYSLIENELRTLLLANARDDYAFRVVDRAVPPIYRASPRRTLLTAFGIAGGGFVGLLFVLTRGIARLRSARLGGRRT